MFWGLFSGLSLSLSSISFRLARSIQCGDVAPVHINRVNDKKRRRKITQTMSVRSTIKKRLL